MKAQIIDGKKLAADTRAEIARGVAELKETKGVTPGLAVILVGDNPASVSYVTAKEKACREAGMLSREIRLAASISEDELIAEIEKLNADPLIHGILVQLPLPKGFSEKRVIDAIAAEKDVDGFTPVNVGKMLIGDDCFLPCTPHGIIKLIEVTGMNLAGKHAVVIGRSNIVGKPVAALLSRKSVNATVPHGHGGYRRVHPHRRCGCGGGRPAGHTHRRHAQGGRRRDRCRREPGSGRRQPQGIQALR